MMMPQGISVGLVPMPENAALMAVKILALSDLSLKTRVAEYLSSLKNAVVEADAELRQKEKHKGK
jgi:phosphoribosylcarboxyaminoimidazole (NCAIR) mutase